ncbi:unknown [Choristoneura fumiferana multiple nucleopolyhedrovirus]|uniref:P22.2 n=1 Tax=Choristoneura fumiferana nuclear polyhedrosis virus TaxID=208973 RepID=O02188_NPVCF|nr:unknown [Choristoneura fumiferana multiple nucleopolyhedrovirus]AAB53350.1 unknown [Choristoneura fumiferana multiple nucleopolyhedrovirus]
MKTPQIFVYFDDKQQEYVEFHAVRSDVLKINVTYDKHIGSDHVLKVAVKTGQRVLAIFKFGEKIFRLIDCNPTFDGFYDKTSKRTKQFKLGDFNEIKQLVQHDQEQLNRLVNQTPVLDIVIKEWVEETPRWETDGGARIQLDGGFDEPDDGNNELESFNHKPVGYETNVLNKNKYTDVKGKEGPILAEIKITFVSKQFINVV